MAIGVGGLDLPTLIQRISIQSDSSKAESETQSSLDRISQGVSKVGVGLSVGVTLPIVALAKSAVTAASDVNEQWSKVGVVFGENAKQVQAWSQSTAGSIGISERAALAAAGTFGNLFRSLGIAQQPAADMSMAMVKLAADLASFNNANPEEVLQALQSGLVGEVEPLRRFGVSLSQARIEAEALAAGIVKPTKNAAEIERAVQALTAAHTAAAQAEREHGQGSEEYAAAAKVAADAEAAFLASTKGAVPELTAAQKAQASYKVIMEDTALAQGDFSRTAGGLANQQRILSAEFDDAKAKLGKGLLPVMIAVVGTLNQLLTAFNAMPAPMQKLVMFSLLGAAALGPILVMAARVTSAMSVLRTALLGMSSIGAASGGGIMAALAPILPWLLIAAAVVAIVYLAWRNWDKIVPVLKAIGNALAAAFRAVRDFIGAVPGFFADLPGIVARGVEGAVRAVAGFAGRVGSAIAEGIGSVASTVGRTLVSAGEGVARAAGSVGSRVGRVIGQGIAAGASGIGDLLAGPTEAVKTQVGHLTAYFEEIGPKARDAFGNLIAPTRAALGLVNDNAIQPFITVTRAAWSEWGEGIKSRTADFFGEVGNVAVGGLKGLGRAVEVGLAPMVLSMRATWGVATAVTRAAWTVLQGAVRAQIEVLVGVVRGGLTVLGGIFSGAWSVLGGVVRAGMAVLTGVVRAGVDLLTGIFRGFADIAVPIFVGPFRVMGAVVQAAMSVVANAIRIVLDLLTGEWGAAWNSLLDILKSVLNVITTTLSATWDIILGVARAFWDVFGGIARAGVDVVVGIWNGLRELVVGIVTGLVSVVTALWQGFLAVTTGIFQALLTMIQTVLAAVGAVIFAFLGVVSSTWSAVWGAIAATASAIWGGIQATASAIWGAITGIFQAFIAGLGAIFAGAQAVWDGFLGGLRGVRDTLGGIVGDIVEGFRIMARGIQGAIEGAIRWVENNIHRLLGPLGSVLNTLNRIPGLNAIIPGHAFGGRAEGGEPIIVGERGPELLVPESNSTIISNDALMRALASGRSGGSSTPVVVDQSTHVLIEVEKMEVRDDQDIVKVSRDLQGRIDQARKAKGLPSTPTGVFG